MTTTIAPSIGHVPLITQTGPGTSPGYDAVDFRRLAGVGQQEGVTDVHCFEATQRGAGANMSVDISANQFDTIGAGVAALVRGTGVVGQGFYEIPAHSAVINEAIGAAHATLPRVDAVVLEVRDTTHDGSGSNDVRTRVIAGTATAGATLDNRTGAANLASACPGGYILLSDVLVGAAVSSITNAVIRDRRKWARGAYAVTALNNGSAAAISSTSFVTIDSSLKSRVECSGAPLKVSLRSFVSWSGSGGSSLWLVLKVDGTELGGAVGGNFVLTNDDITGDGNEMVDVTVELTPSAGSHTFEWFTKVSSGDTASFMGAATGGYPATITVEEVLRQNTKNNPTTTG